MGGWRAKRDCAAGGAGEKKKPAVRGQTREDQENKHGGEEKPSARKRSK